MKGIRKSAAAVLAAALLLAGCASQGTEAAAADTPAEKYQTQVFAMDTVMILTAYGDNAEEALDQAEEKIYALEEDLDPESETGSVCALNSGAGSIVEISEDCYSIMSTAMEVYEATDGALDPGLYPIIKAWGFISGDYRVPTSAELAALLAEKDTAGIRLDEDACSALVPEGTEVSFGAVAKGYTAQCVTELLAEAGVESAILSLGGNVQTLGEEKPDGSQWQVAVIDPNDTSAYVGILSLGEAAVVTSGGYQRYFEEDGVTYIHIIDPVTGCPVDNDLASVTVVTADGTRADALSTALFVMGSEEALAFCEESGDFELVLVTKDGRVIVTAGLTDCFEEKSDNYEFEYLA